MAQLLGDVAVGSTVYLNENGSPVGFYVIQQNYNNSLNPSGRTYLIRSNNCSDSISWSSSNFGYYGDSNSTVDQWLTSTYLNKLDSNLQQLIPLTKIKVLRSGNTVDSIERKIFLPAVSELNNATPPVSTPTWLNEGPYCEGANSILSSVSIYTRSPNTTGGGNVFFSVGKTTIGQINVGYQSRTGIFNPRPCLTLSGENFIVNDSSNIIPIPNITTLTTPSLAMVDQSIPISWTPVSVSGYDVTYQLQRNVNNGGWQNVGSPVSQTSYTDTAQVGWTQVQYQVAAVVEGVVGAYTQSSIIPVSDPQTLVISGQDGNLGTLTSNLPYTVSSNTGNPISLTRTVNNVQVVTLTVASGFAYSIPIADLPTGTGTIQITASVESGSETVTQTRTWTYYKTPINIPSTGGIAQLTQNGQNIWPVTVPDAVEAPVYLGGNLNAALNKLGQAALYTKIGSPKYNQVTVDLSKVKVGDEVLLPENGVMVPFIVGSLNYEPTLNTSGNRVLLIRKNVYQTGQWNSSNVNTYANSTVDIWLNNTYKNLLGQEVQDNIGTTTFQYTPGNGNWTVTNLTRAVFLLSLTEMGLYHSYANTEGKFLGVNNIEIVYNNNGSITTQWTRSPNINNINESWRIRIDGSGNYYNCNNSEGYRPCFTLPTTFTATYYVDSSNNIHPSQEYTTGGSITDVFGYDVPICQYEFGSYTGTGTYGSGNPNSLTFSFEPKVIIVTSTGSDPSNTWFAHPFVRDAVLGRTQVINNTAPNPYLFLQWSSNGVSWWVGSGSAQQLNVQDQIYAYVAIG